MKAPTLFGLTLFTPLTATTGVIFLHVPYFISYGYDEFKDNPVLVSARYSIAPDAVKPSQPPVPPHSFGFRAQSTNY